MEDKIIYHIDVNSAFLSWSAANRVKLHGDTNDLRDIPAIVGGDQDSRHGIVLTKSIPAKRYGIQTGEPIVKAKQKCPNLTIIPPEYDLYVDSSKALIKILESIAPKVEQYSIDEAWCDMTGTEKIYGSPVVVAEELREKIYSQLGFTVNIGISSNKLLAKMASDFKKPNRVHTLFPEEIPGKMWPLPVSELFYVGRATTRKLNLLGIKTIGELACTDPSILHSHLKKHGDIVWSFANGIDVGNVENEAPPNKGYGNSMTVPFDVIDSQTAHLVLLSLCETLGSRLRKDNAKISCVAVSITSCEFSHASHQMQLFSSTNVNEEIHRATCILFDQLWDKQMPIRQLGVHTSKVAFKSNRQYNIFDMDKYERLGKLNTAIDEIRARYGEDAIMRASFLDHKLNHFGGGTSKERRNGITKKVE